MDQTESDGTHIESWRFPALRVARLFVGLQLLASGILTAFSGLILLQKMTGYWISDFPALPILVGSVIPLAASIGFLLRRRWARTFLIGECALIPLVIVVWLFQKAGQGGGLPDRTFEVALGVVGVGIIAMGFAFNSNEVRDWCDRG